MELNEVRWVEMSELNRVNSAEWKCSHDITSVLGSIAVGRNHK